MLIIAPEENDMTGWRFIDNCCKSALAGFDRIADATDTLHLAFDNISGF
jgi:hypothetical protein